MAQVFGNNISTSLGVAANSIQTVLTVATGDGAKFPVLGFGDYFLITLVELDDAGVEINWEIVKVTGVTGDVLTVQRAQEGTVGSVWPLDTKVELRLTAGSLDPLGDGSATSVSFTPSGGLTATDVQAALVELDTEKATAAQGALADTAVQPVTNYPTIRPTLNLCFADTKSLDPRVDFTRSSTATYYDQFGVLRTAGLNEPRFQHDPVTGECGGLLIEGAKTNLLLRSEEFDNAAWVTSHSILTANAAVAPDGTLTAYKMVESDTVNTHFLFPGLVPAVILEKTCTLSLYAKSEERSHVQLRCGASSQFSAIYNLTTGEVTSIVGPVTASAVSVGNGWWRVSLAFLPDSGFLNMRIGLALDRVSMNYTGDGTSGIYIWGAQLEEGDLTSYIKTEAAQVTRAADAFVLPQDDLVSVYNEEEGAWIVNASAPDDRLLLEAPGTIINSYDDRDSYALSYDNFRALSALTLGAAEFQQLIYYPKAVNDLTPFASMDIRDVFFARVISSTTVSVRIDTVGAAAFSIYWGDGTVTSHASGTIASKTYPTAYTGAITIASAGAITRFESAEAGLNWRFDLASLPAGLTYFNCGGVSTVTGDIAVLPAGLTLFNCGGATTVTGDIAALPAGLTFFVCTGSNTITGDIAALPAGLTYFGCLGTNTVTGDIAALPAGLNTFNCWGTNTVTGDIAALPVGLMTFSCGGFNVVTVSSAIWSMASANFRFFFIDGVGLTQAHVDNALVAADTGVASWANEKTVSLVGANATPSATGLAAKASLQAKGVTVNTN